MAAYIILQVEVHDAVLFKRYLAEAGPTGDAFGCEILAADNNPQTIEGTWYGPRTIIARFPSEEQARAWHESDVYAQALALRRAAAHSNAVLVKGLA
jgi:uncharacterized protein (DUF1330 family)